jgi:hypothetical protein
LHDMNGEACAPKVYEIRYISCPKCIDEVAKISDPETPECDEKGEGTHISQISMPQERKVRRNKVCVLARKCLRGIQKGVNCIVDRLYRFFDGKMMVILRGSCYCVWITLGILLGICAVPFAIAACAASCLT